MRTASLFVLPLALGTAFAASEPATLKLGGVTLSGTLELPSGNGPFPVALIVAGSGPTDRDGNSAQGLKTDAYKLLAQGLAARGIASLRYDKRGVGESVTNQREQDLRFGDFVNDAGAWIKKLQADPRFSKVGVIGHSEGALIGLLAAQKTNAAAFVSIAGPGENAADSIIGQLRANPNNPPALVAEGVRITNELRAGRMVAQVDPLLAALYRPSVQPYVISWFRYDPAQEIARLNVPTLIVQGDRDLQVSVKDARKLGAAQPKAELVIVEGMNHVLKGVGDDAALNRRSYADPTLPLAPGLLDAVSAFLLRTLK